MSVGGLDQAAVKGAPGLLFMGFNQDFGCVATGTTNGFRIHACDPLKDIEIGIEGGGIGWVEPLFRCNIVAIVGGGSNPKYPPNKVMIYDDNQKRCIGEMSFRSPVRAVRLRRDRVVVVLETKIYVYNFADLKLVDHIETRANPKGLCALCPYSPKVLACLGHAIGSVKVELYDEVTKDGRPGVSRTIDAHKGEITALALNCDGTRLATASEQGTVIRVWSTHTGEKLQELRRSKDPATIYSLNFNLTTEWLACSSDKPTVHIWSLKGPKTTGPQRRVRGSPSATASSAAAGAAGATAGVAASAPAAEVIAAPAVPAAGVVEEKEGERKEAPKAEVKAEEPTKNVTSWFAFASAVLPYVGSEWSFAQYRLPSAVPNIVAFGEDEPDGKMSIIVVCADGNLYKAIFDPRVAGEAVCAAGPGRFLRGDEATATTTTAAATAGAAAPPA